MSSLPSSGSIRSVTLGAAAGAVTGALISTALLKRAGRNQNGNAHPPEKSDSLQAEVRALSREVQELREAGIANGAVGSLLSLEQRSSRLVSREHHGGTGGGFAERVNVSKTELGKIVVLVGMRGAGKSSLGKRAATELKRKFIDLDQVIEKEVFGHPIAQFVAENGWKRFREEETKVLRACLIDGKFGANSANGAVIACGGGVLESPEAIKLVSDVKPVIWVKRHIDDISRFLDLLRDKDSSRPAWGESVQDVYARRQKAYEACSDYIFTIRKGDEDWTLIERDFATLLRFAVQAKDRDVQLAPDTFIMNLIHPQVEELVSRPEALKQAIAGIDVLELRADWLLNSSDPDWLLEQLALLRRHVFTPICFTLRSVEQGGRFQGDVEQTLRILKLAMKAGCELIDVDAIRFTSEQLSELDALKGMAKMIGSHVEPKTCLRLAEFERILQKLMSEKLWDIHKVVMQAQSPGDTLNLYAHAEKLSLENPGFNINLTLQGDAGKMSRVLNKRMTSVMHPALSTIRETGQLTLKEVLTIRHSLKILEEKKTFYIFGHPVALSASPTMQNVGFRLNGTPHFYDRYDSPSIEDVAWKLSLTGTGGGSVTIPHKEAIMQHMDDLSESARAIGAVNTVTKETATGKLRGDNTDWIGIKQQLLPKIKDRSGPQIGLIVGAGGTARAAAYAFRSMKLEKIYILNRTFEKAQVIAQEFGDTFTAVQDVSSLSHLTRLDAVMGTLPGQAGFTLPDEMLRRFKPAVIEAAYRSSDSGTRFTPLLQQAAEAGCETIEGMEMLFEQGCAQCEIWTGKPAPRREIASALLAERYPGDPNPPKNLLREASASDK